MIASRRMAESRAISACCGPSASRSPTPRRRRSKKERRYIEGIPPDAGLIELSHMYGLGFLQLSGDLKLSEVADAITSQNVHWGSFLEMLNTNDPNTTIGELGRKNAIGRGMVLCGTPKTIVDKMEELHFGIRAFRASSFYRRHNDKNPISIG